MGIDGKRVKGALCLILRRARDKAQSTFLASVLCLLSLVLPAAAAPNLFSVSPYVQHPTADGMTILFFTTADCAATVKCWPVAEAATVRVESATCEEATDVNKTWATDDSPVWGTQYRHRVRFEGLTPGTRYCYAVEPVGGSAYTNFFSTVPDRNTPVRFVAYSDSECLPSSYSSTKDSTADGNGRTMEWDVLVNGVKQSKTYHVTRSEGFARNLAHMAAWEPDLFVIAGDLTARGGVQMFWDEFWKENAGANAKGYADWAGAVPILAAIGNHDLYDNKGKSALSYDDRTNGGRIALGKFFSYLEFPPNGDADYDQHYFRQDYGPVTIIFLDTNNGTVGSVSPSFKSGSAMYRWLESNLADAQKTARFTFVVQHHCPYSRGKHNGPNDAQSALPIREALSGLMTRYGVTAWIGGHEEVVEHATLKGAETLSDGTTAPHTVHVFDLGSGGDGLKGAPVVDCTNVDFRAYSDAADGTHYGHLRVEVRRNAARKWECAMSQVYSYIGSATGPFELRTYNEYVVESAAAPDEPEFRIEEPRYTVATRIRWSGGNKTETQYRGFLTQKGRWYAFGTNGVAETEWVAGDGTPCELKMPEKEGLWELMVRE